MKPKPQAKKPPKSATIKLGKKISTIQMGNSFFLKHYEFGYKIRKRYEGEITISSFERNFLKEVFTTDIDKEQIINQLQEDEKDKI